ncbi:succinyl-diaminopimelate desuccinylase [Staphylococcus gallinarum]|uniref:Succinyl-diaminopimelate desuccinylase n=1 Tax=Staphylococcus gallinarum TaxID=1293 RepID=A0A380FMM9_STAGA|nr:succinyl-diaminopimelate desuccinylase [Staphylococcus gallinarum]
MGKLTDTEIVNILSDLVRIKSVNDNEIEVCHYLQDLLAAHNIPAQIIKLSETRANLVAEIGEHGPVLAISGHMDVVSEGDISKWHYDPFVMTEVDGKLYGRGTADMKSGLAALVISMIQIQAAGTLNYGKIRLLATAGEENRR